MFIIKDNFNRICYDSGNNFYKVIIDSSEILSSRDFSYEELKGFKIISESYFPPLKIFDKSKLSFSLSISPVLLFSLL